MVLRFPCRAWKTKKPMEWFMVYRGNFNEDRVEGERRGWELQKKRDGTFMILLIILG